MDIEGVPNMQTKTKENKGKMTRNRWYLFHANFSTDGSYRNTLTQCDHVCYFIPDEVKKIMKPSWDLPTI